MEKDLDIVGLGECLIEMSEVGAGLFQLGYAGDVLNTLFYASRLGLKSGLLSSIGTDHFTRDLVELLDREMIDISAVPILPNHGNGLYAIRTAADGTPTFSFWRAASAARETLLRIPRQEVIDYASRARYVHFSAVALAVLKERERLFDIFSLLDPATTITFDTNFRPQLWDDHRELIQLFPKLARHVQILFVTDSDDAYLFGPRSPEESIAAYRAMGFRTVVLRRGMNGCVVTQGAELIHVPAVPNLTVVDSTGAGDAFNAGFLMALTEGKSELESARMGNAVAACTLSVRGGVNYSFRKDDASYFNDLLNGRATEI